MSAIKILIVEDENIVRSGIHKMIRDLAPKHVVSGEAASGLEALEQIRQSMPDLILLDIRMPGMDGVETAKRVYEQYPGITIIIISGYTDFDHAVQLLGRNVVDYILKPISPQRLLAALEKTEQRLERERKKSIAILNLISEMQKLAHDLPADIVERMRPLLNPQADARDESAALVQKALQHINNNFDKKLSPGSIARHMHVSHEYLCRSFRADTGMTLGSYLTALRICKAKELLSGVSHENIGDIARMVGFEDAKHFSKSFKAHVGVSPSDYRAAALSAPDADGGGNHG